MNTTKPWRTYASFDYEFHEIQWDNSPEIAQFMEAIRTSADSDDSVLVFADWLDEQGDPRGDYLRGCCQLAQAEIRQIDVAMRARADAGRRVPLVGNRPWFWETDETKVAIAPINNPTRTLGFISEAS